MNTLKRNLPRRRFLICHLSLIFHSFFIAVCFSCLRSLFIHPLAFNVHISSGFNFSHLSPSCLCYSSLPHPHLPSLPSRDQWLVCQYSVHPLWAWGDLAHCLWLHPSGCPFILLWNGIGWRKAKRYYGNTSHHCKGLINLEIFSLVIHLYRHSFVALVVICWWSILDFYFSVTALLCITLFYGFTLDCFFCFI